jgi:hypothetical protein
LTLHIQNGTFSSPAPVSSNNAEETLYNVFVSSFSIRQFIGQTSGVSKPSFTVCVNTVDEFVDKLFEKVSPYLKREVLVGEIGGCEYSFSETTVPTRQDLERFVIIKDPISKKPNYLQHITTRKLVSWKNRELSLWVHQYSNSISNKTIFNEMKNSLFPPALTDRSGASSFVVCPGLANKLKSEYEHFYSALDIHWIAWANYIPSQAPERHDFLIKQPPPPEYLCVFGVAQENHHLKVLSHSTRCSISNRRK